MDNTGPSSSSGGPTGEDSLAANAGDDLIGELGASFFLDGCASTFGDATLCDFTEQYLQDNFEIAWFHDGTKIADGITATLLTGNGTMFDAAKDYILSLEIIFLDGDLPILTSSDYANLTLNSRTVIPVPGAIGLFGFGLLGLGWGLGRKRGRSRRRA